MTNLLLPSTRRSLPGLVTTIVAQLIQKPLPGLGENRCIVTTLWTPAHHPPGPSPLAPLEEPAND